MANYPHEPLMTEFDELCPPTPTSGPPGPGRTDAPPRPRPAGQHPELDRGRDAPQGARFTARTMDQAMTELYNPAQLDVLARVGRLAAGTPGEGD